MTVPIKSLLTGKLDIRLLAALLMMMGAVWWCAFVLCISSAIEKASGPHLFWTVYFVCFLWGGPVLALGLIVVHPREAHKYPYWVYPAVAVAVTPWLPMGLWYVWAFSL